jgi:hypothetical protein
MNTGIQDAFNLGWKLAQVVQGKTPEALLIATMQSVTRWGGGPYAQAISSCTAYSFAASRYGGCAIRYSGCSCRFRSCNAHSATIFRA